jgi:hypothetical protein
VNPLLTLASSCYLGSLDYLVQIDRSLVLDPKDSGLANLPLTNVIHIQALLVHTYMQPLTLSAVQTNKLSGLLRNPSPPLTLPRHPPTHQESRPLPFSARFVRSIPNCPSASLTGLSRHAANHPPARMWFSSQLNDRASTPHLQLPSNCQIPRFNRSNNHPCNSVSACIGRIRTSVGVQHEAAEKRSRWHTHQHERKLVDVPDSSLMQ